MTPEQMLDLITYDDEYLGACPVVQDGRAYLVVQHRVEEDGDDHMSVCVYRWEDTHWGGWTVYDETGDYDDLAGAWEDARRHACQDPTAAIMGAIL